MTNDLDERARELRRLFDATFAAPERETRSATQPFLLVRVASESVAVRVLELGGIEARRPVLPIPAAAPGLLGLAGVRGLVVPVFGLASLLGLAESGESPWIILSKGADPIGLAFSELEGHFDADPSTVSPTEVLARTPWFLGDEVLSTPRGKRPVISIQRVVNEVRAQAPEGARKEGQA